MKTVWKFALAIEDHQRLELPSGAEPLHVDAQDGWLMLWALVDTAAPPGALEVYIRGTGHFVDDEVLAARYVGSVLSAPFVWHVWARELQEGSA